MGEKMKRKRPSIPLMEFIATQKCHSVSRTLEPQRLVDKAIEKQVGQNLGAAEKSLPLFKTLKKCVKKSDFRWTPEAEQAFKQLKQHISELPKLVAPRPKEELIMYLSTSQGAVGAVLMTERDSIQTPVYFVSQALQGPELNYTPMEKLILALVFMAKRLRRYFQAHPIAVITEQPIRQVMSRPEILAISCERPEEVLSGTCQEKEIPKNMDANSRCSSCIDGLGAGLILTSLEGAEFTYALRFQFTASNNEAEYEALLVWLYIAAQMGVRSIRKQSRKPQQIKWSAIEQNCLNPVSAQLSNRSVEVLQKSPSKREVGGRSEEEGQTLITPITEYLKDGVLPDDKKEANKLRIKARQYELMDGILYRRSFLWPWLRCVGPLQADYVIREIHEGMIRSFTYT
ncbi:reverse transcriptase domain-containing protein [Tanacetum coccineum]